MNNLGSLYKDEGRLEVEEMYERALKGKEKAWGLLFLPKKERQAS